MSDKLSKRIVLCCNFLKLSSLVEQLSAGASTTDKMYLLNTTYIAKRKTNYYMFPCILSKVTYKWSNKNCITIKNNPLFDTVSRCCC